MVIDLLVFNSKPHNSMPSGSSISLICFSHLWNSLSPIWLLASGVSWCCSANQHLYDVMMRYRDWLEREFSSNMKMWNFVIHWVCVGASWMLISPVDILTWVSLGRNTSRWVAALLGSLLPPGEYLPRYLLSQIYLIYCQDLKTWSEGINQLNWKYS